MPLNVAVDVERLLGRGGAKLRDRPARDGWGTRLGDLDGVGFGALKNA